MATKSLVYLHVIYSLKKFQCIKITTKHTIVFPFPARLVSIVIRLHAGRFGVRMPIGTGHFLTQNYQTSSGAHLAFNSVSTVRFFHELKRPGLEVVLPVPSNSGVMNEWRDTSKRISFVRRIRTKISLMSLSC